MTQLDADTINNDECGCRHPYGGHHHNGRCQRTITVPDYGSLDDPKLDDDKQGWPSNWPEPDLIPWVTRPCWCPGWHPYNPSEQSYTDENTPWGAEPTDLMRGE